MLALAAAVRMAMSALVESARREALVCLEAENVADGEAGRERGKQGGRDCPAVARHAGDGCEVEGEEDDGECVA
jgi:hypothetical protein